MSDVDCTSGREPRSVAASLTYSALTMSLLLWRQVVLEKTPLNWWCMSVWLY